MSREWRFVSKKLSLRWVRGIGFGEGREEGVVKRSRENDHEGLDQLKTCQRGFVGRWDWRALGVWYHARDGSQQLVGESLQAS